MHSITAPDFQSRAKIARKAMKRFAMTAIILPAAMAMHPYAVIADWRDSKALREELGRVVSEAEAIAQVATSENRDLSADEATRIDAILGVGEPGKDGFKAGMVHSLKAQIARMEKIETARDTISGQVGGGAKPKPGEISKADNPQGAEHDGIVSRVVIPASVHRPATLKAHRIHERRIDNERAAYAFGQFAIAVIAKQPAAVAWCTEHGLIKAGMTEGTPADGGYTVPSELDRAVMFVRDMYGVFRREAEMVPMSADTKDKAKQTSGLPYFYIGEAAAITDTGKLAFANVALVAKKVAAIVRMSSELSEDSIIDIGDAVALALGEAFALAEDHAGFIGDGTGTYGSQTGIIPGMVGKKGLYVPAAGIVTLAQLTNAHFRTIISMLPGRFRVGAKWYCDSTVYDGAMAPILDAAGGNTQGDLEQGPGRLRFKGYDVAETQVLSDAVSIAASSNVLIFGNLKKGSMFGSRRELTIVRSDQVYWTTDEIGIKGTQRFNTKNHELGDADTVGAFVVLKLPAA